MRFLHTSDWHLGRTVRGQSRRAEHEAALQQVLGYIKEYKVDCFILAGDVFDTSSPSPESEQLLYWFFGELHGLDVPSVVVAGNHDHPKRFDAVAPLLESLHIHARGEPRSAVDGAVIEIESKDGKEHAKVATLPWVGERASIDFDRLQGEEGAPLLQYADRVKRVLDRLGREFTKSSVNVIAAHLLAYDAVVGQGGGERELHMAMGLYGVPKEAFTPPSGNSAQYVALGHVHKPQTILKSPRVDYSGSLLQLDFGERNQDKFVNLIEAHAGLPVGDGVHQLPITAGRPLIDVGSAAYGVPLNELAQHRNDDAYLRVFVEVDIPLANLAAMVREQLPTAVHVERSRRAVVAPERLDASGQRLGPEDLFGRFYASTLGQGREPTVETMQLFRRLLEEESHASSEA